MTRGRKDHLVAEGRDDSGLHQVVARVEKR